MEESIRAEQEAMARRRLQGAVLAQRLVQREIEFLIRGASDRSLLEMLNSAFEKSGPDTSRLIPFFQVEAMRRGLTLPQS